MDYIKDKIIPLLIGATLTGILSLIVSIFSDIIPTIAPFLKDIQAALYLKVILLLCVILVVMCILAFVLYERSKEFKPFKKKGKYRGFKWVADINAYDPHRGWDVYINFICPVHKVHFSRKDAKVPECEYSVLWCRHCNKEYPIRAAGDIIHLEEASRMIKTDVISKLKVRNKS